MPPSWDPADTILALLHQQWGEWIGLGTHMIAVVNQIKGLVVLHSVPTREQFAKRL